MNDAARVPPSAAAVRGSRMRRFVPVVLPAAMVAATLAWFAAVQARETGGPAANGAQAPTPPVVTPAAPAPARATTPPAPRRAVAPAAPAFDAGAHSGTVKRYCAACHSERGKAGGLSLAGFDAGEAVGAPPSRREDDPQAARRHDAARRRAASARGRRARRAGRRARNADRRRGRPRAEPGLRVRSSGSTAPSTSARSRICSPSTSTSRRSCRPTPSARASTTSPTRRRSRRR